MLNLFSVQESINQLPRNVRKSFSWAALGMSRTLAASIAFFLFVLIVYLSLYSYTSILANNLRVKRERIADLHRENTQLRYDIASATAPAKIDARAVKLGLTVTQQTQIVYIDLPTFQADDHIDSVPNIIPSSLASVEVAPSLWGQIVARLGLGDVQGGGTSK